VAGDGSGPPSEHLCLSLAINALLRLDTPDPNGNEYVILKMHLTRTVMEDWFLQVPAGGNAHKSPSLVTS
jgi:hypothetical protein